MDVEHVIHLAVARDDLSVLNSLLPGNSGFYQVIGGIGNLQQLHWSFPSACRVAKKQRRSYDRRSHGCLGAADSGYAGWPCAVPEHIDASEGRKGRRRALDLTDLPAKRQLPSNEPFGGARGEVGDGHYRYRLVVGIGRVSGLRIRRERLTHFVEGHARSDHFQREGAIVLAATPGVVQAASVVWPPGALRCRSSRRQRG